MVKAVDRAKARNIMERCGMAQEIMHDCSDCEHYIKYSRTERVISEASIMGDSYKSVNLGDVYECHNYSLSSFINGDRSCQTLRATSCGREAVGFKQIDWETRRIRKLKEEYKYIIAYSLKIPFRRRDYFYAITLIGWAAIWFHRDNKRSRLCYFDFDKFYTWDDDSESYKDKTNE